MSSQQQILEARLDKYERERRRLASPLRETGFIWHGSIHRSLLTCGTSTCRCHADPNARHGPYAYWTTKVGGKSVSRLLKADEANLLEEWIDNRRQIENVVRDLKALSVKAARVILKLRSLADASQQQKRGRS